MKVGDIVYIAETDVPDRWLTFASGTKTFYALEGKADLSNYYTKPEIDEKFEAIDALVSELTGSKSEYVDLLNELNGDV